MVSEQNVSRLESISLARGVAIIAMVVGHAYCGTPVERFVSQFHMPLFFIVSGFCFKEKYWFYCFFLRRIRHLILPFVGWGTVFLLLHNFQCHVGLLEADCPLAVSEIARRWILLMFGFTNQEQLLGGYWFLPALFFASLLSFWVVRVIKEEDRWVWCITIASLVVLSGAIGYIPYVGSCRLFFKMIYGSAFFVFGTFLRKTSIVRTDFKIVLIYATFFGLGFFIWPSYFSGAHGKVAIGFFVSAVCGALLVLAFCGDYSKRKRSGWLRRCVSYAGDRSLSILTWHFLAFKVVSACFALAGWCRFSEIAEFPIVDASRNVWWMGLCYLTAGVCLPLAGCYLRDCVRKELVRDA